MRQLNKTTFLSISLTLLLIGCTVPQKKFLKYINEVEYGENKYALFKESSIISEPSFYVLKFANTENPVSYLFKSNVNKERTISELREFKKRVILEHFDRTKERNPQVKIVEKDFLVIQREGLLFSLYDLKKQEPVFNEINPFGVWGSQNIWAEKGTDYNGEIKKNEKSDYGVWVKKNIEDSIMIYINKNK